MKIEDIRPFIPSKDYQQSISFYQAMGFNIDFVTDDLSLCTHGSCTFFLRRFYQADYAANFMCQLIVSDINEAYANINSLSDFDIKFDPIQHERWGSIIYLWGPAGELWHVTQLIQSS